MATVAAALLLAPSARAGDDPPHDLGDHPAVVVQRLYKAAGYDYASKFYPHPAGLRLYAEPPRDAADGAHIPHIDFVNRAEFPPAGGGRASGLAEVG